MGLYSLKYQCRSCKDVFTRVLGSEAAALAAALRELTDGKNATALAQGGEPPVTLRILDWHACEGLNQGLGDLIAFAPVP